MTFQESLRPELPFILGNKEYEEEIKLLDCIHNILLKSGIESLFIKRNNSKQEENSTASARILC